ncbi:hypothetical protein BKK81_06355 [Cupriavidus sp. USMAHM13]|nr:hypothetical protein BKK81_06355 [Cupriavidus sp. USMAHM13]
MESLFDLSDSKCWLFHLTFQLMKLKFMLGKVKAMEWNFRFCQMPLLLIQIAGRRSERRRVTPFEMSAY